MKRYLILVFLLVSVSVNAHETEDVIRLQMANDALTIRVSELLEENKRLKEFVERALIEGSQGKKVRRGCDPQNLRKVLVTGSGRPAEAKTWLKKNHSQCSIEQLQYMHDEISQWSEFFMGDPKKLIRYYIDNM